jgi:hypothetical protein
MSVRVIGTTLLVSDVTAHQAKSVGDGHWVVSFLPGRTLTLPQSLAALRVAEDSRLFLSSIAPLAAQVGLTALETIGLTVSKCDWPQPEPHVPRRRVRLRRWLER